MGVFKVSDGTKDSTTTSGTGTITLANTPPAGYQSFNAGIGDGNSTEFVITNQPYGGTDREVSIGKYTNSNTTLTRDLVKYSTNGNALLNLNGSKYDVFCQVGAVNSIPGFYSARAGADQASFANVLTNIAGMSFPVQPNEVWSGRIVLELTMAGAAAGVQFQAAATTGFTSINAQYGTGAADGTFQSGVLQDAGGLGPVFLNRIISLRWVIIELLSVSTTTAGNFQLQGITGGSTTTCVVKSFSNITVTRTNH